MTKFLQETTVEDVAADAAWRGEVLDVQRVSANQQWRRTGWDTLVFTNAHDCKVILRLHNSTGAVRLRAEPAPSGLDLTPRDPYEIELMPDVPFNVLSTILENLK